MKLLSTDFFSMGGYGLYVWLSYGVVIVVLAGYLWAAIRKLHKAKRSIYRWFKQNEEENPRF